MTQESRASNLRAVPGGKSGRCPGPAVVHEGIRPMIGIYSERQAEMAGTFIYEDSAGREYEVSQVCRTPEEADLNVQSDRVIVGRELVRFVRRGRPPEALHEVPPFHPLRAHP